MKYRKPFEVRFNLEMPTETIDSKIARIEAQLKSEEIEQKGTADKLAAHLKEKWREKSTRKADAEEFKRIWKKIDQHTHRMISLNRQLLLYQDIKEGRVPAVPTPRSDRA